MVIVADGGARRARCRDGVCYKHHLWTRGSWRRSAPSSSARASPRRLSGSASRSLPSASRSARSRSASGSSCSTARAGASSRPRRATASTGARSACSRSSGSCSTRSRAEPKGLFAGSSRSARRPGPGGTVVPVLLCEFAEANPEITVDLTISDTQTIVEQVARRELELGVVGATPRNSAVAYEPFFRDEVILVCPPDHRVRGQDDRARRAARRGPDRHAGRRGRAPGDRRRAARRGDAAERPRRAARARASGVGQERRRGRARRDVHLADGGRARARDRDARGGAGSRPRAVARDLARARRGPRVDPRRRRVRRVRAGNGCDRSLGPRRARGAARGARRRASVPRREPALAPAGRRVRRVARGAVRPHRGRRRVGSRVRQRARGRRRQRDRPREGDLGRDRASARLGADDVLGRRVDADLRDPRSRPADERRRFRREARRDRLRPGAHARPPAAGDGRNFDERARPRRRGALRQGAQRGRRS